MAVKLREKKLKNGMVSYYLDIYHLKSRWYEFLDIKINKKRPDEEDRKLKELAFEIRTKREFELKSTANGIAVKSKTNECFVEYVIKYCAKRNYNGLYQGVVTNLKKFTLGKKVPFEKLSVNWIKEFEQFLIKHISNNSTIRYLLIINGALIQAVREKKLAYNIWNDIPTHERLKKQDIFRSFFSIEDIEKLACIKSSKVHPQIQQAFLFSCFTGLRWSDCNCLKWEEIKIVQGENKLNYHLYFEQEKTEQIEYIPLSQPAIQIIEHRRKEEEHTEQKSPYVFPVIKEIEGSKLKYQWIRKSLKRWAELAGINPKHLHFHAARHSFATNMLEHTDLYVVSKLLGHRDIKTTTIYAHIKDKRKIEAVESMSKLHINLHI